MNLEITRRHLAESQKKAKYLKDGLRVVKKRARMLKGKNKRLREEVFLAKRKIRLLEFKYDKRTRHGDGVYGQVQVRLKVEAWLSGRKGTGAKNGTHQGRVPRV